MKAALLPLAVRLSRPRGRATGRTVESAPDLFASLISERHPGRFLVVRQDNRLGNLVLISPFLQALRAAAPQSGIGLLTGDRFAELYAGSTWINRQIVERKRWLIRNPWAYPVFISNVRRGGWDATFEISNADTHSFNNALMAAMSGAPWRIGFDHLRSRAALNIAVPPPDAPCHYSLAPLLLLSAVGCTPSVHPMRLPHSLLAPALLRIRGRFTEREIIVHLGGRGPKGWPLARFERLIAELSRAHAGPIRVIGGQGEQSRVQQIARTGRGIAVEELRDLVSLVAVLLKAKLYIGCDAGPLHVAAAAGVPTVSLFLQSDPIRYAPLGDAHEAIVGGRGSRRWLTHWAVSATRAGPIGVAADQALARSLFATRPRCVEMDAAAGPGDEVAFVTGRVIAALSKWDRIPAAPAAVLP